MNKQLVLWASVAAIGIFLAGIMIGSAITVLTFQPAEEVPMGHMHDLMEFSGENPPSIEILATPDAKSGYNLEFVTENFVFAPQASGEEHVSGQGHVHLYVNDVKVARPYSEYFHVDAQRGDRVHATLNTNTHMAYAVQGQEVADEIILE